MYLPKVILNVPTFQSSKKYSVLELFAGAGGLALGFEKAGLKCKALIENNSWAAKTLRMNRPNWNVMEEDIYNLCFKRFRNEIDVVSGGFPCQSFSYAGKSLGLKDDRGKLFYEFARVVGEVQPKIFIAENVKGLLTHDGGETITLMVRVLEKLGYRIPHPKVLNAVDYGVPQKRERVFLIGIRKDIQLEFKYPEPVLRKYVLKDVLKMSELYSCDVPISEGLEYSKKRKQILDLIPQGGCWRDLPIDLQKNYMKKSFYLDGGKTGIARRLSWDEPSLTLLCNPIQKQTERCHPDETRPFTIREYARIQTFPDKWEFSGSIRQQYKQIGNAVPVKFGYKIGKAVINFFKKELNLSRKN